ncbi:hypothetical protein KC19_2G092600 [Ceratodon purpureus]|uniref:Cytochrome P450 n=1 Tax=Ceratodon purpureus TaxID=3225 RepID=A0A8T0ITK5_CERPU|nr:hypothetical protein KC19_2G092600 [Ceratodon purpureus]
MFHEAGIVEMYWMAATLMGMIGGMILLRTWMTSCYKARGLKLPPGPWSWPIVGCLPFLPKVFPRELLLAKLAEKYGELMMMRVGARTTVVVSSVRMAKEFLKTHDHLFANRPNPIAFQYIGFHDTGLSSMANTSPLFRPTRRMFATDIVSPRKVATTAHVRREQLLKMLRAIVQDLQQVNVSTAVSSLAMNLALCMNFGKDYDAHDTEILVRSFRKMVILAQQRNISDLFPALRRFDLQGIEAGLKEVEAQWRQSITALIEKKKLQMSMWSSEEIKDTGIISKLLSVEGANRFSEEQLIAVVFTLLIAGTESISNVVTESIHEVVSHPHIYERAMAELDAVVGTERLVEESDIVKLPFIHNIIKETLRLHAPAPTLLPHRNFQACEVGGYHIPANSTVLVNLHTIMRDPAFWHSPMEFSPDRWNDLSGLKMQGSDFHYIPFGYGERQCPAITLGTTTVQYALAVCLQCVKWRIPAGMERAEFIATPQEPRKKQDLILEGTLRVVPRLLEIET